MTAAVITLVLAWQAAGSALAAASIVRIAALAVRSVRCRAFQPLTRMDVWLALGTATWSAAESALTRRWPLAAVLGLFAANAAHYLVTTPTRNTGAPH